MSKSSFLLLVALIGGLYQNRVKIERWLNPPPAKVKTAGQQEVVLYSTTWCGYCAKTRQYFGEHNIAYTDLDVEHSELGEKGYQELGGNGVPIVVINQDTVIHGYAPEQLEAALQRM